MKRCLQTLCLSVLFTIAGCQKQEFWIHGRSSVLSHEWKSQVEIGKTTESDVLLLLGKPTAYYHRTPYCNEKYLFYSATVTIHTITHYPFFPNAQFASDQQPFSSRIWFLVSNGIVTQQIESGEDPDLTGLLHAPGPDYPWCEKTKCSLKAANEV